MKNILSGFLLLAIITGSLSCKRNKLLPVQDVSLLPAPAKLFQQEGRLIMENPVKIYTDTSIENIGYVVSYLDDFLSEIYGIAITETKDNLTANIILNKNENIAGNEAYHLLVSDKVIIEAKEAHGIFYGIQTLLQLLLPQQGLYSAVTLSKVDIEDSPAFKWRGMHLDVSRHFFPVETVKKLIDLLAMHKMNTFHWHLTDDQGWRIEIKQYPKLTKIGGWRNGTVIGHMANYPLQSDSIRYGGYYTQEEIIEVIEYANKRFVRIVPEIEMPGHAMAALAAYPQYSCTGGPFDVWTEWGINANVYCPGKDSTFTFLENVLTEVFALFPGEYIHIGGDECLKDQWQECSYCQKRIDDENLEDELELQSYFVKRIEEFVNKHGKKLIGWDEILEGGLPERAVVMSWRGTDGGVIAASHGHDVVMTPNPHLYFDQHQSNYYEPLAIGGITTVEEVYNYNPVPAELDVKSRSHILGAQANLWTEYITTPEHLEYMIYPRLCALAERLWSPEENINFDDFNSRLSVHLQRLDLFGVNYRIDYPNGILPVQYYSSDTAVINLLSPVPGGEIRYTLNGTEPESSSYICDSALVIHLKKDTTILKLKLFLPSGKSGNSFKSYLIRTPGLQPEIIEDIETGLSYRLFNDISTLKAREITSLKSTVTGTISNFQIPPDTPSNFFGIEFNGYLRIDAIGQYVFSLYADDGAILFIDDLELITNDNYQYGSEKAGSIEFSSTGYYPIRLLYFNAKYGSELKLDYEGPGVSRTALNKASLFRKSDI
ncbi:MAG: family 20 glycosylhydrolase [Bacteroidales bacterium]|nr:family 20 glycosylhydrolase [Bacteroidales bacterium]